MIDLAIYVALRIIALYIIWKFLKILLIQIYLWRRGPEYRQWVKDIEAAIDQNSREWRISNNDFNNSQTAEYESWYHATRNIELDAEYRSGTPAWYWW
jgi:hypothetical protein